MRCDCRGILPQRSGKYPVNLFTALYPVEYDRIVPGDPAPDPVVSHADTIIIFKSFHPADVIPGEKIFCGRDLLEYQPLYAGPVTCRDHTKDLLRKVSCSHRQAC